MTSEITAIGVDAGGTFTDYHALDEAGNSHTGKVNSTPDNPSRSIERILEKFTFAEDCRFVHGTTVATNALLEDDLSDVVLVTNKGLEGLLDVGRGTRRDLYDLNPDPADVLPFDQPVVGVDLRDHPDGATKTELLDRERRQLREAVAAHDPEVIAVCLVHAYRDDGLERTVEDALKPLDAEVLRSSDVLPRFREYERAGTTTVTAGLKPLVSSYLRDLESLESIPDRRFVMGSNRGTLSFEEAINRPALTALSGPAGGVIGARNALADRAEKGLITMDIGGTSTDVSLVRDRIPLTDRHEIGGYPLAFPMVDVHTIGSGGGSILWKDQGGHLRVGPKSAGANPGPACYGDGGPPTLTDAQLALGRIPRNRPLSDDLTLRVDAAESALAELGSSLGMNLEELALGALRVANSKLVEAIRSITVKQGHRPSDFVLVGFGGAGGLFAPLVAESLGVNRIYVPREAGVASASGLLTAPRYVQHSVSPLDTLEASDELLPGVDEVTSHQPNWSDGSPELEAECRFRGQTHTLTVPADVDTSRRELVETFRRTYEEHYGYRPDEETVELVHLNASWRRPFRPNLSGGVTGAESQQIDEQSVTTRKETVRTPVLELETFDERSQGPLVLSGDTTTLFVPSGWTVQSVDERFLEVLDHG